MNVDWHLHTTISDGLLPPLEVVERCAQVGLQQISITDHDAVGAYRTDEYDVQKRSRELGLKLTVGIELDVVDDDHQLHLLGFGFDPDHPGLQGHLHQIQSQRRQRGEEELAIVNKILGDGTVLLEEALPASVDTVMKPHLIRALLDRKKFDTYKEAKVWVKCNVFSSVTLVKLPIEEGIALIKAAGGTTSLAHPGFYFKDYDLDPREYLTRLRHLGLDAVEAHYPYSIRDPKMFTREDQDVLEREVVAVARDLKMETTRGSDCHYPEDFASSYGANGPLW